MILIKTESKDQVVHAVQDTIEILTNLGIVIHPQKSKFEPSQQLGFLRFLYKLRYNDCHTDREESS